MVVLASVVIGFIVGMVAAFITRFSEHVHGRFESSSLEQVLMFVIYLS